MGPEGYVDPGCQKWRGGGFGGVFEGLGCGRAGGGLAGGFFCRGGLVGVSRRRISCG